jgi:hypothetical protein
MRVKPPTRSAAAPRIGRGQQKYFNGLLGVLTRLVAELGGYVPRKSSPPGPQTTWLGLQRVHDFALCWQTFGPDARNGP